MDRKVEKGAGVGAAAPKVTSINDVVRTFEAGNDQEEAVCIFEAAKVVVHGNARDVSQLCGKRRKKDGSNARDWGVSRCDQWGGDRDTATLPQRTVSRSAQSGAFVLIDAV